MIDVVHIITKLELGGAQENTLFTCRLLDRSKFRVTLIYGPGGLLDEEARSIPDLKIDEIPDLVREVRPHKDAACTSRLTARLSAMDPARTIVHTHSSKAGILGRFAAKNAGLPHVVHSIHGFGFHEGQPALTHAIFLNAERGAAKLTEAFIGVSRANLAEAQARGIIGREHRVKLIRSGFDLDAFAEEAKGGPALREELGFGPDDELIVCIANMKPQKDPLTMVEAMRLLVQRRPRATLLYAGDGVLRPQVEAAIAQSGLQDRFRLLGWRRDVPALMGAADVVALSSIFEGLPRVSVQALVTQKPFVGTRVDGTPEVIRSGRNGFLVEPRNAAAFAAALDDALTERPVDPTDLERLRPWRVQEMVQAQQELYEELVG